MSVPYINPEFAEPVRFLLERIAVVDDLQQGLALQQGAAGKIAPLQVKQVEGVIDQPVRLAPREHLSFAWLPWREAAAKCFSWSNRDAIRMIGDIVRGADADQGRDGDRRQ